MAKRLADILGELEMGVGKAVELCGFLSIWGDVVDERVGRHAQAVKIRNRTLYVSTSSSTWAHELSFLKKDIIEKFNKKAGREVIGDIRFRAGG
ncbi:DUF721 domain-containing protein [Candidatus Margulisiibacteriota bacterium]